MDATSSLAFPRPPQADYISYHVILPFTEIVIFVLFKFVRFIFLFSLCVFLIFRFFYLLILFVIC